MNLRIALPIALLMGVAFLPVSCKKAAEAAGVELTAENAGAKATEAIGSLTEGLKGLGDMTDVTKITEKVGALGKPLALLEGAKKMLGDKMPSLGGIGDMVGSLTSKFAGQEGIMKILGPFLEKLKGLIG